MNYIGTSGPDNLAGTSAADFINGLAGDDNIVGNGGEDTLYGGQGNDNIVFGPTTGPGAPLLDVSSAIIYGGLGSDTITSTGFESDAGFNTIYGGTGDPTKDAADGKNYIDVHTDANTDFIVAGGAGDFIYLGTGSGSSVTGGAGNDTINANIGSGDSASFNSFGRPNFASNVKINANMGNDLILGSEGGGDLIHGGMGNDTVGVIGTTGSTIAADKGDDLITVTGLGNNSLYGGMGNDIVAIGAETTVFNGFTDITSASFDRTGKNVVFGGLGADSIAVSGQGNDSIYAGTDTVGTAADSGNVINASGGDVLTNFYGTPTNNYFTIAGNGLGGAGGNDLLVGGGGNDIIVASDYQNPGVPGLKKISVDTLTGGGGSDAFAFGSAGSAVGGVITGYSNANAVRGSDVDQITDFVSNVDQLAFTDNGSAPGSYVRGDDQAAQIKVNNVITANAGATLSQAAAAAIQGGEAGANNSVGGNAGNAFIFNYQNSNYLIIDSAFNDAANNQINGDYLIGIGNVTNLSNKDING